MATKGHLAGGGIAGKNVTKQNVRIGIGARAVDPQYPGQPGGSRGNSVQRGLEGGGTRLLANNRADVYGGPSFRPAPLGNAVAASTKCGVGGSRTVYKTSTQGQHGQVAGAHRPPGRSFDV
jgi:hypothetical protein